MKRKTTRRALVMSLLSLLLCMSMLVGTTFAWFTDSVTSGVNKITAGNLDLEVYYGDPDDEYSIEEVETLFNDVTLWEPGAVAWENITVINLGTLALKYDLTVSFDNENTVEGYGLSTALEVGVVGGGVTKTTREEVQAEVAQWYPLQTFVASDILLDQNEFDTYGIVIRWLPKADDNLWNVNNGKETSDGEPLHIDLGIEAFATQMMEEYDSFGPDYDENAPWTSYADISWYNDSDNAFTINSAEELAGLAEIANGTADGIARDTFAGKTVTIGKDIDLNGRYWTPISQFNGVLDGQNHTIYNMVIVGEDSVGFIGRQAGSSCTIKDLTFSDAYVEGYRFIGTVMGYVYGSHTLDNVDVVDSRLIARYGGDVKGIRVGGLMGFLPPDGHSETLINCDVTGCVISGFHNVGAMIGTSYQDVSVTNCTATDNTLIYGSDKQGAFAFGAGNNGYVEYIPASGFTATDNEIVAEYLLSTGVQTAIDANATELTLAAGATIELPADLKAVKAIYANGATVSFTGTIANDLEVFDAEIPSDVKISGSADVTFEACSFTGNNGINYTYCNDATFRDCTFDCAEKAIHFDTVGNSLTVIGCEFIRGKVMIGGSTATAIFADCVFGETAATSIWSEKGIRVYIPTKFVSCEFNNRNVLAGSNGLTLTFEDCTVNDGDTLTESTQIIAGGNVPTVTIQ